MELNGKIAGALTPSKSPQSNRSKICEISKHSENSNPNVRSPGLKLLNSPAIKSARKTQKSASKNPNPVASPSPRNKIRERKFVVAKKNLKKEKANSTTPTCKCKVGGKSQKCLCVAYETLRASQEEFFKNPGGIDDQYESEKLKNLDRGEIDVEEKNPLIQNPKIANGYEGKVEENDCSVANVLDKPNPENENEITRDKFVEEVNESVPEPGAGRVMDLVKAFERLLSIPKSNDSDQKDEKESEDTRKGMKWALPESQGLKVPEMLVSSSSFCPLDFVFTSETLGLDSRISCSLDSSQGSFTISNRNSGGGRRSRRNSSESSGTFSRRHWKRRQLKSTCQKPFKLRTEQRGRNKEEEFVQKVQQMIIEEEKRRIRIAQGLPWTTDEPQCLVKPPVKERTRPVDLVLHSDIRAVERAEFEQQLAEKMCIIEQYKMEREKQQKLAEEEEIKRLKKELIPKAQPMPYFDRPLIPKRSLKHPTIPKEPKFHIPQYKKIKCFTSWNDFYTHTSSEKE